MPRCAARHVKLVAEAEQLVLPFLAPRLFQPWPTSLPQSSSPISNPKSFSTTSCEHARQSRSIPRQTRSTPPKYESARSLLVQQWYESAIAPLEDLELDQHEHVEDEKKTPEAPENDTPEASVPKKRTLSRTEVQKAYYQRWSTSQALVKSRWTVAKQDSAVRTKWSSLGRPVRRKSRQQDGEKEGKEDLVFSADGNTLYWNHHFAKLNARHDTRLTNDYTPRTNPNLNFRSKKWATQMLNAKQFKDQEELAKLLGEQWRRKWMHALLWTLANSVDDAIHLLEITHVAPYMPAAYIADSLSYIVGHFHKNALSDDTRKHLVRVVCTVMERPGTSPLQITGNTFRKFLQYCSEEEVLELFSTLAVSGTLIHWNTRLHFSTYLARHDRFDQALDSLLDAVSDGADVKSRQFESCCATILRKAAKQPDGLRVSLRLVQNLSDIGVQLNVQLCNIVMLNAVEADDLKTAFSIYNSLVDNNLRADRYTHAILLKGCKTTIEDSDTLNTTIRQAIANVEVRHLHVVATEIIHCLSLHHFRVDPENAFSTISEAYTQLFDASNLINLGVLSKTHENTSMGRMKPTLSVLGIMTGAYLRHSIQSNSNNLRHIYDMYRRWHNLAEHCVNPYVALAKNDHVPNSFLLAFVQEPAGLPYAAEVIRDMQTSLPKDLPRAKPTVRSWSIFLHGFAKHGKMELAEQVLTYMRQREITPNEVTWNSLLGGYVKLGRSEEAVQTFVRMRDEGFEADEVTQRHFGRIKLDSVSSGAWKSNVQSQQAAKQDNQEQQEVAQDDRQKTETYADDRADSTKEVVDAVQALSV
ncbi:hypothetical protein E4T39_08083 [Aureobasidium subglaciale]|nr:hypothetical protein E4T39_08083 [Aureobasidium subglaciale]